MEAAALDALKPQRKPSGDSKRVRELDKQLRRKDKALAEAAALLVLKKKPRPSRGKRTTTRGRERRMIIQLIDEAVRAGARREKATALLGLSRSWEITYLRGPVRGSFFYLYLIVDVWSRKIVGGNLCYEESAEHARALIEQAIAVEGVDSGKLVLHADNGGPMKGSTLLAALQRLGVVPSFSRPSVSDDNPFSKALFRTMKDRPNYPRKPFQSFAEGWKASCAGTTRAPA